MNRFVTRAGLGLVAVAFTSVAIAQHGGSGAPAKDAPKAAEPAKKDAPKADAPKAAEPKKDAPKADAPKMGGTVVDVAMSDSNFTTLVSAIKAAGLAETLSGKGPFTVFAPTNEAFAKLPADALANLMKPENKAQLVALLKNHVVSGNVMAADVKAMNGKMAKTLDGKDLLVQADDKGVMIGGAKVTKTDLKGSNGVIHVIDTVIMTK